MKLSINQQAPDFKMTDIYGQPVQLKNLKGQKVYLAFQRNAGCPVCNLQVHQLLKHADDFMAQNIAVLLVYESSLEKMREYLGENTYPFHFIADPDNKLYNQYGVGQSLGKFFKSLFHGLIEKATQGKKLYKKSISQDGHTTTIPAEFVIDKDGKLSKVHYGEYIGDHLPIESLL
ncbi:MAG TPA: peroxiredoxin-like family protein [Ohtaekwangia sp.]|uniref:peroxiredoxin-like family protein n=1 Tax=Ohtaekwangia sp. TaxID=2066019 RepID=UPI002F94348F